ncbi:MAG: glutamate--tRNA ligase [Phycisphaeraceae bacterium]
MLDAAMKKVVTRFAPSPTGALHVGGARTALFNWAYARKHGGQFILRMEDTDQARSSDESTLGILRDMVWLGLDWDQGPVLEEGKSPKDVQKGDAGPYFQSQRLDIYRKYLDQLLAAGKAYECYRTQEELAVERDAARAEKRDWKYDPTVMRNATQAQRDAWKAEGRSCVIRLRNEGPPGAGDIVVNDEVLGEVKVTGDQRDDFVIFKGDGFPTYHFAVVVDDALMGVTHVIRAQEHLSNTPKHVAIQEALGFARPSYAHLPLIFNQDGTKMSKRDKAKVARLVASAAIRKAPLGEQIAIMDILRSVAPKRLGDKFNLDRIAAAISGAQSAVAESGTLTGEGVIDLPQFTGDEISDFLNKKNDRLDIAAWLALIFATELPEINVSDFRRSGYLPGVILNYLSLLGWNPGDNVERFDLAFLVERFGFDRVGKSNSKFDRDKLKAFNGEALRLLSPDDFEAKLREHAGAFHSQDLERLGPHFSLFAAAYRERSQTLDDPFHLGRFFLINDDAIAFDAKAVDKVLKKDGGKGVTALRELEATLAKVEPWDAPTIHNAIEAFAKDTGRGLGDVAQPLRVALTGTSVSPPIHDTLAILGKDATLARIRRCVAVCAAEIG